MEPTADQVRVLASALTQLRSASTPTARVQAVRTATRAVQGLAVEDRQVLLERLLAHGAPVAAGAVSRHLEDAVVPAAAQTAIAQDLLGLAPVEVARIAEELVAASAVVSSQVPEPAWAPPSTPADPDLPPPAADPPRAASAPTSDAGPPASSDPGGATPTPTPTPPPPPLPGTAASRTWSPAARSPLRHRSPTPIRRGNGPTPTFEPARRAVSRSDADRWSVLATALAEARDGRARRELLAVVDAPLPGDRLPALLAAVPPGWQRRMVLRHLLAGAGVDGPVPSAVLEVLERDGDRFAVAAQLTRAGLAEVDAMAPALPDRLASRLRGRRSTVR